MRTLRVDMNILNFKNYDELSYTTAEMIAEVIRHKPDALLCFPAGETSIGTFVHLTRMVKEGKISFRQTRIVGLDEWTGLGSKRTENCFSFLKKHFFDQIDYLFENLCFFNGESPDLHGECIRTDNFIMDNGPIDMILLGAGMNGHLGLNEPGSSFGLYSHIIELDDVTKRVGQKYFSGNVNLTGGITLGIKHILESEMCILQISGAKKKPVVERLLNNDVSIDFPASALKLHQNSYLCLDKDAAET